jgi:hypothetical protein
MTSLRGPATKDDALSLLEQARTAETLHKQFYLIDAIVNRYDEVYNDEEVKVELRKFSPILKLIKGINMSHKYTQDELNQLYDNCTEFFTDNLLTS